MANITDLPSKPVLAERNHTNPGDAPLNLLYDDVALALSKHYLLAVETRLHPRAQDLLAVPHLSNSLLGNVSATDIQQVALATSPGAILHAISHALFRPSERLQSSMRARQISLGSRYATVHVRLGATLAIRGTFLRGQRRTKQGCRCGSQLSSRSDRLPKDQSASTKRS